MSRNDSYVRNGSRAQKVAKKGKDGHTLKDRNDDRVVGKLPTSTPSLICGRLSSKALKSDTLVRRD